MSGQGGGEDRGGVVGFGPPELDWIPGMARLVIDLIVHEI